MATSDIAKQAVFDARIVQHPARYAVDKGALSLTNAPYNAIAASASQHTYNINVPSQNVFVDRAFMWSSACLISLNVAVDNAVSAYTAGQQVLRLGQDAALCAFPLQELVSTLTATINDTSTVINLDTVLHEVLRMVDCKEDRLMRTCPTMLDKYASYTDADSAVNNPLSSYYNATESAEVPNGAWGQIVFCDPNGVPLSGAGSYVSGGITVNYINGIPVRTNPAPGPEPAQYPLFLRWFSTEHLVLSPFIFADAKEYNTGLFGVNNIQLVMNMKGNISRVLRQSNYFGRICSSIQFANFAASGSPFQTAQVNVQFLTPSLDIPLPPKSIVPFMEFPRYITTGAPPIPPTLAPGVGGVQIQSQTIVLPQIPDMLIIYCKPQAYAGNQGSLGDFYYPITRLSVNFDNFAGLLSSHTTEQLYQMSVHNGLKMDYSLWRGFANRVVADAAGAPAMSRVQTTGGFLVLKPGQDITLQSGQAPSLIGNFTLQFQATVENYSGATENNAQLFVIAVNSGFFETLAGSSRIIKGVLSEADIISAEPVPEGSREDLQRMVGSGFFSKLGSFLSKAKDIYSATKPAISQIKGMLPEGKMKGALSAVGYGHAGAGMAGAGHAGAGKKSLSARLM
jgi:hypothetical protein